MGCSPWGRPSNATRGWLLLVAAGVLVATALLARLGIVGGAGVVVAWFAALLVAGPVTTTTAWVAVVVAAVLLGAAEIAHRLIADRAWWSRWDVPLLISAGVVAATALASASGSSAAPVITVLVGVEILAVAWRLRSRAGTCAGRWARSARRWSWLVRRRPEDSGWPRRSSCSRPG